MKLEVGFARFRGTNSQHRFCRVNSLQNVRPLGSLLGRSIWRGHKLWGCSASYIRRSRSNRRRSRATETQPCYRPDVRRPGMPGGRYYHKPVSSPRPPQNDQTRFRYPCENRGTEARGAGRRLLSQPISSPRPFQNHQKLFRNPYENRGTEAMDA